MSNCVVKWCKSHSGIHNKTVRVSFHRFGLCLHLMLLFYLVIGSAVEDFLENCSTAKKAISSSLKFGLCPGDELVQTQSKSNDRRFPDDFIFGAATSAHQIEGVWNEDGKGLSIWDKIEHNGRKYLADNSTAEVACDSYHLYKRDVEMLREINAKMYRFSISWSRILPYGFANYTNPAGIAYYNNLIDELLANGIEPFVTIFHWDLPAFFQELGGFANPFIVTWFTDYARVLFESFGDRVKYWTTLNEPFNICFSGYGFQLLAPLIKGSGTPEYLCLYNLLKLHAQVYHMYDKEFRPSQGGKVGIVSLFVNLYSATDSEEDIKATEFAQDFFTGIFVDPIYKRTGDYPQRVKEVIAEKSSKQGFPRSRLIELTKNEISYIQGTYDFMGVNAYTSWIIYKNSSLDGIFEVPSIVDDMGIGYFMKTSWEQSTMIYNRNDPHSLYYLMKNITRKYGPDIEIFITETGWASDPGLQDDSRVRYFDTQLNGILSAIIEGVNIKGFFAWSLMDNFEWGSGYVHRMGLYDVDFKDPKRTRTPKKSAFFFKQVAGTRTLDPEFIPKLGNMIVDKGH